MKTKLQNHYAVSFKTPSQKLDTPLQSTLLYCLPKDRLFVDENVYGFFLKSKERNGFPTANESVIICTFDTLVEKGFVKLVESVALERFVEKL